MYIKTKKKKKTFSQIGGSIDQSHTAQIVARFIPFSYLEFFTWDWDKLNGIQAYSE